MPHYTEAEFETIVRRAGLTLDASQRAVLHEVLPAFEAMLDRVRTNPDASNRDRAAEPAHIFIPGQK